ncbi:MAG: hypothetical protein ACREMV_07555 [Gemmatimonadales bacterium]
MVLTARPSDRLTARPPARLTALPSARPPVRPTAQSRLWRPEERVLITDFSQVDAVAASPFTVYGATPNGLLVYDRRARAWRLPVTPLDGYPTARVRAALADPVDDAVWLATDGGVARYSPTGRQWDRGVVAGGVSDLMLDARDPGGGIFVRTRGGWAFVPRGFGAPVPAASLPPPDRQLRPLTPDAALAQAPAVDAMRSLLLLDPRLRLHRFTSAARTADQTDLFFGTNGMGLVRVDAVTGEFETLAFGLEAPRAAAVAAGVGGVWVASDAPPGGAARGAVTWLVEDLSTAVGSEGATGAARPGLQYVEARDLWAGGGVLWLASDAALFRLDRSGAVQQTFRLDDVRCLAPAPDGVWVGTARGLAIVTGDGQVERVGGLDVPVLSLLAVRESLWVGSAAGLGLLVPGASRVEVPAAVAAEPGLRVPIQALARLRDTIVVAAYDQLAWRDPATGRWTLVRPDAALGRLTSLAGDATGDGVVWVGGSDALAGWSVAAGTFTLLRVPGDLPAGVRDLVANGPFLWVATEAGVVRLARRAALGR